MIQKTNKNIPRRNKYILENILLNIFKFYILKCIIKFLQSHDNNKKKNSAFIISRNTSKYLPTKSVQLFKLPKKPNYKQRNIYMGKEKTHQKTKTKKPSRF